ncbi:hypothetical protein EDD16DRAFT_37178 [Pisolithus croceorrhizus]|nr:hypothetical protein EV401DRAFT_2047134 [Pisolithus croceorrhizus]KAI6109315.1 hypothetical protein EDD16DRAFT_37178 [Pisolithus croceorrhizus]KAI6167763.1 hypothetical protein EDD17DRAFT_862053 [Pisolithus thermaeus]
MSIAAALEAVQAQTRSLITYAPPLANSSFVLQSTSVAGLLGGEEATSTVALPQVCDRRRWLGWYNSPGSYVMGRRFRRLAHSATVDVVFDPDGDHEAGAEVVHIDPSLLFEHDGWSKGPVFKGAYSGSFIHETGPLASLLVKKSSKLRGFTIRGRQSQPVIVTVASLKQVPDLRERITFYPRPPVFAIIPILSSLGTCIACALYGQWYAFSMILLGILARGFACVFIGSGKLIFDHPKPAEGSPSGDGILGYDRELTLLKGEEHVVNSITRGRMFFRFRSKYACYMVEFCSILLIVQAIAQLILIPQSQLFGQLMFLISLAISWTYNVWLSSVDKREVRKEIFSKVLGEPNLTKFTFPNRVSAVVFLLLALSYDRRSPGNLERLKKIMDTQLPTDADVWEIWKETVVKKLRDGQELQFEDSHHSDLSKSDETLLKNLLRDAESAYAAFEEHRAEIVPQEEMTKSNGQPSKP